MSTQGSTPENITIIKGLVVQVTTVLMGPQSSQPRTPAASPGHQVLATECQQEPIAGVPAFSGVVAASYNKLPNPLSQIFQRLPVVDGLEVDKLLPFFKTLFQLSDFPGMSDRTLLELAYTYCRGSMAERVAHTLRCEGSVAAFHREVLDAFVHGRLLQKLRHKHFYRVQSRGESLACIVQSVRDAAQILGLGLPEEEIVQIILEGVTPQERLRLVFAERPRRFVDLDKLCVMSLSLIHI